MPKESFSDRAQRFEGRVHVGVGLHHAQAAEQILGFVHPVPAAVMLDVFGRGRLFRDPTPRVAFATLERRNGCVEACLGCIPFVEAGKVNPARKSSAYSSTAAVRWARR